MPSSQLAAALAAALLTTLAAGLGAPASVRAAELARANIVLKSAKSVDVEKHLVTLPLFRGTARGKTVWYIVTDSSNAADAAQRGALFAPLIANVGSGCAACVQHAKNVNGTLDFAGAPDFAPDRAFKAGPTGFPPAAASPGGKADAAYSPFVVIGDSKTVINAPIVATGDGPFDVTKHSNTHDRVIAIDTAAKTVTLLLVEGFANGKRIVYLSTEASDAGAATIERATFVPSLGGAKAGKIAIDVVANGQTGRENPQAQGLAFAALDGDLNEDATAGNSAQLRVPMNVLATFPAGASAAAYSPLWDANVGVWSNDAVAKKENVALKSSKAFEDAVAARRLAGPGGKPFGPAGFVVNCPVVGFVDASP